MPRLEPETPQRQELIDYMTAAELLGVSPGVLLRWLCQGEFPGERVRVKWHISAVDLAGELGMAIAELASERELEKKSPQN